MNVAFVYDPGCRDGSRGGAELMMDELIAQAPDHVTVTGVDEADTVVFGNCVVVDPDKAIPKLDGKTVWRYHHDIARDEKPTLREWLNDNARHIFTSPFHVELYRWEGEADLIPSCGRLADFKPSGRPTRKGIVTVGSWQAPSKGARLVSELVAERGEEIDCYGTGQYQPYGNHVSIKGPVQHSDLPAILWQYEEFVFLPIAPEPFGRCIAEAWAAGCEVVTNDLVGARWWIENEPDRLYTAAADFWDLVCPK
jgi:glycosyltransferase involved in cell wall biosynthesis